MALDFLKCLIVSRGRSETIKTHQLMPWATILCPESEKRLYDVKGLPVETVPDEVRGLGPLRNWVLDHYQEEVVVMADDDISHVVMVTRESPITIKDPNVIQQIIYGNAIMARDLGTSVFGFSQSWDVRKFRPDQPFSLNGWVGGVIGVVGRRLRFEENNRFKVDIDFCLKSMLHDRIVWKDERFGFVQKRDSNKGGNSLFRTTAGVTREMEKLKAKWGQHINFKPNKTGTNVLASVNVKRRQLAG